MSSPISQPPAHGTRQGGHAPDVNADNPQTGEGYDMAVERVDRALSGLDASLRGLNGRMRSLARIESDVQRLEDDRAALANELGRTTSRAKKLDASASEVSRRLVFAMENVQKVLSAQEK